jgi:hypothetical protein
MNNTKELEEIESMIREAFDNIPQLDEKLSKLQKLAKASEARSKSLRTKMGAPDPRDDPYGWQRHLKPLSKGIVGEEDKPKRKRKRKKKKDDEGEAAKAGCEAPINVWHDKDGEFSTKRRARSYSTGYEGDPAVTKLGCRPGKFKTKGGKNKLMTRHPSGKKPDQTKHPYKVSTGQKVSEDKIRIDSEYLRAIVREEMLKALKRSAKKGGCSFPDLLKAMSLWSAAEKGDLNKPGS